MEYFGQDLTKTLKKDVKWPEQNVDKLVRFFIRALRMMKQRGIIHGDIKPHNIVCNEEFDFKLIDFDNSGFHRSSTTVTMRGYTEAYAIRVIKTKISQDKEATITADEWRKNDLHCAAITILQVAYGISDQKLKSYRADEASLKAEIIDKLPKDFPNLGLRLKDVVEMMMRGEDIDKVAQVYDEHDLVLCQENFERMRDKKLEDEVVQTITKMKVMSDEMTRITSYLVKGVDLRSVKETLSSLPKIRNTLTEEQLQQMG
eukprot:TRINITY_DN3851_c0_g1_i10.p1 TRINITY_DN3851_c0_g1~~TRINITY_DN3851_c0_g1_i10.p1  ORF type:complete len:259 (-),score=57.64 TRINITY_DN3851_c0_g1_i10:287-1063(-)